MPSTYHGGKVLLVPVRLGPSSPAFSFIYPVACQVLLGLLTQKRSPSPEGHRGTEAHRPSIVSERATDRPPRLQAVLQSLLKVF